MLPIRAPCRQSGHRPASRGPAGRAGRWLVACGLLLVAAAPARAQEPTQIRPADLRRLLPTIARSPVLRVGAEGGERDSVAADGVVTLRAGEFLAVRADRAAQQVRLPFAVLDAAPDSAWPPSAAAPEGRDGSESMLVEDVASERAAGVALPYDLVVPSADREELLGLRPVVLADRPLRYDPGDGRFHGSLSLALVDTSRPSESRPLAAAIRMLLSGDADAFSPDRVELNHTNLPVVPVTVVADRVLDSLRVRIVPEFDVGGAGVDVWLRATPTLVFDAVPDRIQGLGVQSASVVVSVRGTVPSSPVRVAVHAEPGSVEPEQVEIGPDGFARFRIRSAGIGTARITASSPLFGAAAADLEYGFPTLFLLATLLGGVVGGVGAWLQGRGRPQRSRLRFHLLRGMVFGLVAATAYYVLGINLLEVDLDVGHFNEAAVFAIAALAGAGGSAFLRRRAA